MTYQITTSVDGHIEVYDLNSLPRINGMNPIQLVQEGRLQPHELYNALRDRGIQGIDPSMGVQSLCVAWARFLKRQQDELRIKNETDIGRVLKSAPPAVVGGGAVLTTSDE